jgi:hypothetical protein
MANTRAQNATLITTNIPDNNEKLVTPSKVREVENAINDSGVNINGDTFAEDAVFEFNNGSKLREGVIQHGFGGGIARVCANDKTDQWEDGFRYLISTTGSYNTVVFAETINNIIPDDTYDETDSWAVGSRIKNLVTGIEYLCTQANEGDAIWVPLSGDEVTFPSWNPTVTPDGVNLTAADIGGQYSFFRVGNIVTVNCTFEVTMDFSTSTAGYFTIDPATLLIPSTTPTWIGIGTCQNITTWPINCFITNNNQFIIQSGSGAASDTYIVFFTFSYSVN